MALGLLAPGTPPACDVTPTSATCTPPGNVHCSRCGVVSVEASLSGNGTVTAQSGCAGLAATATSAGPPAGDTQPERGHSNVPWQCSAAPAGLVGWRVVCSLAPPGSPLLAS
jgi:hypothetical protein